MEKLKGVCLYCRGCNRLNCDEFKGVYRCNNFMPNQVKWEEIYRNEMRKK